MPVLTYPSISAILANLPFNKRRELVKKSPTLRLPSRRIPYRFENVKINKNYPENRLEMDGMKISYNLTQGDDIFIRNEKGTLVKMIHVPREWRFRKNYLLRSLCYFFFGRPGTRIGFLEVQEDDESTWCTEEERINCDDLKIFQLNMNSAKNWENSVNLLKNAEIPEIQLELNDHLLVWNFFKFKGVNRINVLKINKDDEVLLLEHLIETGLKIIFNENSEVFMKYVKMIKTRGDAPMDSKVFMEETEDEMDDYQFSKEIQKIGGKRCVVSDANERKCYIIPTSDAEKEIVVAWKRYSNDLIYDVEAKIQPKTTWARFTIFNRIAETSKRTGKRLTNTVTQLAKEIPTFFECFIVYFIIVGIAYSLCYIFIYLYWDGEKPDRAGEILSKNVTGNF